MTALDFFQQESISSLPVRPMVIIRNHNFKLYTYNAFSRITGDSVLDITREYGVDGFSTIVRGRYVIVYNECRSPARIRWTLMHELAHIFLGHLQMCDGTVCRNEKRDIFDAQADAFTADVLAPLPVLRQCGIRTANDISILTGLSRTASFIRLEELISADQFGTFYQDDIMNEYKKQFGSYIRYITSGDFAVTQNLTPPRRWYHYKFSSSGKKRA